MDQIAEKIEAEQLPAPKGFTKEAIQDWDKTPDSVRANTIRRMGELMKGLEKHKRKAEELAALWEPLRPFDEMARQTGTTLLEAIVRFVTMEQALRQNPIGGLIHICQQVGINPLAAAHTILQHAPQPQQPAPVEPQPPVSSFVRPSVEEKARLSVTGSSNGRLSPPRQAAGSAREAVARAMSQVGI